VRPNEDKGGFDSQLSAVFAVTRKVALIGNWLLGHNKLEALLF